MKTAVIYCSKHQGNTKKLLDAIRAKYPVDVYNALDVSTVDLTAYDLIGFASGVYYERIHPSVLKLAKRCLPSGKQVFFMFTCGSSDNRYVKPLMRIAEERNATVLGVYSCPGYYRLGFLKLFGIEGKRQGHPTQQEIEGAVRFFEGLQG